MKNVIIFSFLALVFFAACDEKDIIDNSEQVGHSKITYYPVLTLNGNTYQVVAKGSTFTDPGATAEAGGSSVPVTVTGTVNSNTVGVYVVTYRAANKDGFSASATRFVVVYSTDASSTANDFSGSYERSSNGQIAVWKKIGPGVYTVYNPGGASGTNLTIVAFNPKDNVINVPSQVASDGGVYRMTNAAGGADIDYVPGTPASYSWVVINPGYGTAVRTFMKQ
jgi:hypothetical protein